MWIVYICCFYILIKSCISNNKEFEHGDEGESSQAEGSGVDDVVAPYVAEIDNATQTFTNKALQDLETQRVELKASKQQMNHQIAQKIIN